MEATLLGIINKLIQAVDKANSVSFNQKKAFLTLDKNKHFIDIFKKLT